MKLTNRLQAAADLVPVCESMADIGTDHGYLPIYLVQEGQIGLRLGGGLAPLAKGEVDGVTICGMGGLLMRDILVENEEKAQALSWLVLQPQGHVAELRQFLGRHHFRIEKEELSMLQAEIGATAAYRKDSLFKTHIERLIRRRRFVIEGAKDSKSERHRLSREKALEEVSILEELL